MKYHYTLRNLKAFRLRKVLSDSKSRPLVFRIYGASGCGKTTYLQDLAAELKDVLWLSCEQIKDILISNLHQQHELSQDCKFVFIENIEDIHNVGTASLLEQLINELCRMGITVITTESRTQLLPLNLMQSEYHLLIRPIKPTLRIIRAIARENNISLSKQEEAAILAKSTSLNGLESLILNFKDPK